jgi:glycine/D-amino acid oxidase-like deaminating enzyme
VKKLERWSPIYPSQIQGGWYFPQAHHTLDPDLILEKLYQSFLSRGGQFQKEEVSAIHPGEGSTQINNSDYDQVVVCTGAFSKSLVKQIEGQFIPLGNRKRLPHRIY